MSFRSPRTSGNGSTHDLLSATPSPSPPPPRNTSARFGASPTSPQQQQQSHPQHSNSPNASRAKREAFPRSQLWTWKHSDGASDTSSSFTSSDKDDLIESMLRECAPTVPALSSTAASTPATPGLYSRRIHHQHHALHHHPHHLHHTPPSHFSGSTLLLHQPSSSLSSSSSLSPPPSTSSQQPSQQQHAFLGSKRRIHKKDASLRSGLASPSSRNVMGAAGDGWRTYKLAHRTNRLIAKTRKAIEVLTKERDATSSSKRRKKKQLSRDGDDDMGDDVCEDEDEDEDDDGGSGAEHDAIAHASDDAPSASAESDPSAAQRSLLERFARDVLDDDDGESVDTTSGASRPHGTAANTLDPDDAEPQALDSDAFWRIYKTSATCKRPDSARGRYIDHCETASLLVLPVLDLDKSSRYDRSRKALRFDNYYFGDERAEAFGDALELLPVQVKHLSMKNVGISGTGTSAILNGVPLRNLRELSLSENRIGSRGTLKIFKSLQDPHVNLKTLDLGNNQLGDQAVKLLIQCLLNRCTLEHLDLRRNQIFHAAKAVGELLRITTPLTSLNLSWNNIRGEPAQHLARCMMENLTLTHLDLSDNTLGNNGNADAELGACLATNKSLTHLDVSNNHIHAKSVLIYVHGLQQNSVLETLVVRGNPIGTLGAEAIVRSVASGSITTCQLDMGECNLEIQDSSSSQQACIYSGGVFTLNLSERADVILLRELLLLCWRNKTEIIESLHNGAPFAFNCKDERSFLSAIPSTGTMQLKIQPNYDRHDEVLSVSGFEQTLKLLQRSFNHSREDEEESKLFCIRLLAEEYSFSVDQVNALLRLFQKHTSQVEKATAAAALIPQIRHSAAASAASARPEVYDCASMETPDEFFEDKDKDGKIDVCGDICMVLGLQHLSDLEQAYVEQKVGKWISFNVLNPTGKYALNMANSIDRRILMRMLEVNKYERKLRSQLKLMDVSQHGERAQPILGNFRNVRLNRRPVVMDSAWQFPRLGVLEFDFVMTKRPFSVCTALSDAAFEKFLKEFKALDVSAELKLLGLRSISTQYYFTCSQAQRVMEHFGTFERDVKTGALFRAEVFVILFSRIVDEWHFAESLALLDLVTKTHVLERIGYLNCFHPLQTNETYEHLLLDVFDQRQLALLLLKLATSGEAELSHVVLNNDTVVESETWRTWTSDEKLPLHGSLSCSMRAVHGAQTEAQLPPTSVRKKLLQTLLLKLESKAHELALQPPT